MGRREEHQSFSLKFSCGAGTVGFAFYRIADLA